MAYTPATGIGSGSGGSGKSSTAVSSTKTSSASSTRTSAGAPTSLAENRARTQASQEEYQYYLKVAQQAGYQGTRAELVARQMQTAAHDPSSGVTLGTQQQKEQLVAIQQQQQEKALAKETARQNQADFEERVHVVQAANIDPLTGRTISARDAADVVRTTQAQGRDIDVEGTRSLVTERRKNQTIQTRTESVSLLGAGSFSSSPVQQQVTNATATPLKEPTQLFGLGSPLPTTGQSMISQQTREKASKVTTTPVTRLGDAKLTIVLNEGQTDAIAPFYGGREWKRAEELKTKRDQELMKPTSDVKQEAYNVVSQPLWPAAPDVSDGGTSRYVPPITQKITDLTMGKGAWVGPLQGTVIDTALQKDAARRDETRQGILNVAAKVETNPLGYAKEAGKNALIGAGIETTLLTVTAVGGGPIVAPVLLGAGAAFIGVTAFQYGKARLLGGREAGAEYLTETAVDLVPMVAGGVAARSVSIEGPKLIESWKQPARIEIQTGATVSQDVTTAGVQIKTQTRMGRFQEDVYNIFRSDSSPNRVKVINEKIELQAMRTNPNDPLIYTGTSTTGRKVTVKGEGPIAPQNIKQSEFYKVKDTVKTEATVYEGKGSPQRIEITSEPFGTFSVVRQDKFSMRTLQQERLMEPQQETRLEVKETTVSPNELFKERYGPKESLSRRSNKEQASSIPSSEALTEQVLTIEETPQGVVSTFETRTDTEFFPRVQTQQQGTFRSKEVVTFPRQGNSVKNQLSSFGDMYGEAAEASLNPADKITFFDEGLAKDAYINRQISEKITRIRTEQRAERELESVGEGIFQLKEQIKKDALEYETKKELFSKQPLDLTQYDTDKVLNRLEGSVAEEKGKTFMSVFGSDGKNAITGLSIKEQPREPMTMNEIKATLDAGLGQKKPKVFYDTQTPTPTTQERFFGEREQQSSFFKEQQTKAPKVDVAVPGDIRPNFKTIIEPMKPITTPASEALTGRVFVGGLASGTKSTLFTGTSSKTKQSSGMNTIQQLFSGQKPDQTQEQIPSITTSIKTAITTDLTTRQDQKITQQQVPRERQRPIPSDGFSLFTPTPVPEEFPPWTPGIPKMSAPSGGMGSPWKLREPVTKVTGYTPSATAVAFNVRGKKSGDMSGIGFRPIPVVEKKKKKK